MNFLEELAARRRFGMKPGLDTIRALCAALGDPQKRFRAVHVAGTNGKGAVCAMLDAALRAAHEERRTTSDELRMKDHAVIGRYTSPHLVRLNERFFLDGAPVDDATLDRIAERISNLCSGRAPAARRLDSPLLEPTFFEALTAVAFELYAEAGASHVVLECGLGGRLDATNVCEPELCVITRIGLDHCDWLGDTVEKIAAEKAGIIKPGVPVVLGENAPSVRAVVEAWAKELGAPFHYAPDLADEGEIPADFSLMGRFNRENAVTALAALKVLGDSLRHDSSFFIFPSSFSRLVWPGRFQCVGPYIVDGAHNPPAARALASALEEVLSKGEKLDMVFGACGDKDVGEVLRVLKPFVDRAYAVRTNNPRSFAPEALAEKMRAEGLDATPCATLADALSQTRSGRALADALPQTRSGRALADALPQTRSGRALAARLPEAQPTTLICGSLFLAGEAIVALNACPWSSDRFDPSERLVGEFDTSNRVVV